MEILRTYRNKMAGHTDWTPAERERLLRDPKIVAAQEKVDHVRDQYSDVLDLSNEDQQLMNVTIPEERLVRLYLNIDPKEFEKGKQYVAQQRAQWEKGWENQRKEIRADKSLTDKEKQTALTQLEERRASQIERGQQLNKRFMKFELEHSQAMAERTKAETAVFGVDPKYSQYQAEEKKYLASRSEAYNKMFKAVDNCFLQRKSGDLTVKDSMEAVCSILEYQDGKESRGGSLRQRVDLSMKVLAQITVGTDAEFILHEQIEKINAARGLRPGQKGALSKESLFEEPEADRSLYDRIQNLGFKDVAEAEEPEAEVEDAEAKLNAELKAESYDFDNLKIIKHQPVNRPEGYEHSKEGEQYEELFI